MNEETMKEVDHYLNEIGKNIAEIDWLDNEGVIFDERIKKRLRILSTSFMLVAQTINKSSF